ncbi:hypothetical protein LCGC14_1505590 [marine sediment metagenome]|uniref:Phage terminase large subunit N-terminal domain-containing protein n=1 Tax=marine sediment metagenome TaxID=412755 RepID=A0A0F9J2U8_9ZZZZ
MKLKLPKILNIPVKLLPMIVKWMLFRYFLLEGGRSGAKSQSIARWLLYLAEQHKLKIVCGRETQTSIEESVYTIFCELIRKHKLAYHILATEIRHIKTGSKFKFRGFREQGRHNIKGLEDVDILWIDEAQAITKDTLDIVIPTIRKDSSKVIFSMNRFTEEDAVYNKFWNRPDCLHIYINYLENQHCPQKMIDEANICKELNIEDYDHIWLGKPRKDGGILKVVTPAMYEALKGIQIHRPLSKRLLTGDPSLGGDECVAYIINENGRKLDELFLHERDEMKIAGCWVALANRNGVTDYVIDVIGFKGIADRIRELVPGKRKEGGLKCNMIEIKGSQASSKPKDYLNLRAEIHMYTMQEIVDKNVEYFDDPVMRKQLCDIWIKKLGSRLLKIEGKPDIRKRCQYSPDRSDAYNQGIWGLQFCRPWTKKDAYDMDEEEVNTNWQAA